MTRPYSATCVSAEIGTPCTSIGNNAFYNCSSLSSITIPDSVTGIGASAFNSCGKLSNITIPDSVTSIDNRAFYLCSSLSSITIGSGVTNIGQYAFNQCYNISSITVDAANTTFDSRNNCNAIIRTSTNTLIKGSNAAFIPNDITSIGQYAFSRCSSLSSITIPDSVTSIGQEAFEGCSAMTTCNIDSGVTYIGEYAFNNCRSLSAITSLATTAPTIAKNTFQNIKTGGTLYVPQGSSGYDVWMGTSSSYLGYYNWTKVEQ